MLHASCSEEALNFVKKGLTRRWVVGEWGELLEALEDRSRLELEPLLDRLREERFEEADEGLQNKRKLGGWVGGSGGVGGSVSGRITREKSKLKI